MADQAGSSEHSALCLRLMQLFPRVTRGMRRWQDRAAPAPVPSPLSPRHVAALEQIRGGPLTVGELASRLDLTLPTVSGVLSDLDRAGLVERRPDPADRRRTIVQIIPGQAALIGPAVVADAVPWRQSVPLCLQWKDSNAGRCLQSGRCTAVIDPARRE